MATELLILLLVFSGGAFGGLLTLLRRDEFHMPHYDKDLGFVRLGWIATVAVGGVVALVVWCVYGPFACVGIIAGNASPCGVSLSYGELFGAVLSGAGGGQILSGAVVNRDLTTKADLLAALLVMSRQDRI